MFNGPLARYVRSLLALRVLAVLVALGGLLQVLDLLDITTEILNRGQGLVGVGHYVLLRAPTVLLQALPLAALIGTVFAFSTMSNQNEVVALRAAGVPFRRVVWLGLPTLLAVTLIHATLSEWLVPVSQRALTSWWASLPDSSTPSVDADLLWFRSGGAIVGIVQVLPDGHRLDGVRIFKRDERGHLISRTVAARALYSNRHWTLVDALTTTYKPSVATQHDASLDWKSTLRPSDLMRLSASEPYVSGRLALAVLAGSESGVKTPAFYRTRVQAALAAPLTALVMLLLATPVAVASTRAATGTAPVLMSLVTGLLFLLLNGLFAALGEATLIAPVAAAWAAPLGFAALGAMFLWRLDESQ